MAFFFTKDEFYSTLKGKAVDEEEYNNSKLLYTFQFLLRLKISIFADIIKTESMFKNQNKLKELEVMYQNTIYICIS